MTSLTDNLTMEACTPPVPQWIDIALDQRILKIGLHHAAIVYGPDLARCIVSGYKDPKDPRGDIQISLLEDDGSTWDSVSINCGYFAQINFRAKTGHISECIRRNIAETTRLAWLEANQFAPDLPCAVECTIDGLSLAVTVTPCF